MSQARQGALAGEIERLQDEFLEFACRLIRIDSTDIIEDSFIIFYMRDKMIYLNVLPHSCPGLKSADTFMYRTSLNRLCDVDVITVLNRMAGGFSPGAACGLGLFYPIDKEIAKQKTILFSFLFCYKYSLLVINECDIKYARLESIPTLSPIGQSDFVYFLWDPYW